MADESNKNPIVTLTPEQEAIIRKMISEKPNLPPSIKEISLAIFNEETDGRSWKGRAIRDFLVKSLPKAEMGVKTVNNPISKLNETQQLFIINNCEQMTCLAMTKELFGPNANINTPEFRSVQEFAKTLDKKLLPSNDNQSVGTYEPPKTIKAVVKKLNQYLHDGLDYDKLTSKQKFEMEKLISYLHTYRFLYQMSIYHSESDQKLFEDSFIRYTYDKGDLNQEEVDQYIILCGEIVIASRIQRRVEHLQVILDEITDTNDPERLKVSMSVVETIKNLQTDYNQCLKRQDSLFKALTEGRAERKSKEIKESASILNLVNLWKHEESRKQLIQLAEKEKENLKANIDELSNMDEVKARVLGLSKEEAMYG